MFLTQIVNGQVSELALCEACARAKGLFDPQSLTFAEKFFPEEFKQRVDKLVRELTGAEMPQEATPPLSMLSSCPVCGFSVEDYRRTGHLGCPDCYAVFARELNPEAEPEEQPTHEAPALTRARLQKELQQAVSREDYERAAVLRDQINNLPAQDT
jgi:protein arginine kinase activator